MVNAQELQEQWNRVRGDIKRRWGQLTEDDLRLNSGNIDQLIGRIQQRTGESREAIEQFLSETASQGASAVSQAAGRAGLYAHYAGEQVREGYNRISDQFGRGYEYAEMMPMEPGYSAGLLAMGGILFGAFVGLVTAGLTGFGIAMVILALHSPAALPAVSGWPGVIFTVGILGGLALVASLISSLVYSYYNHYKCKGAVPRWLENLEAIRRYVADEPMMSRTGGRMQ